MGTRKGRWGVAILAVYLCWGGITGCGKQARQQDILLEQMIPEIPDEQTGQTEQIEKTEQAVPTEQIGQKERVELEEQAGEESEGSGSGEHSDGEAAELIFGEFRTNDTEYREVTQDIFSESDVTMVYIWATFSEQCITELGQLAEISAQYQAQNVENSALQAEDVENAEYENSVENTGRIQHAQKQFQIVGIPIDTLDQSGSASSVQIHEIRKIMKESQADFRQILPSYHLIVTKLKEVTELPEIVFVDRNGYQLGEIRKGFEEERNWNAIIDEIIAAAQ